MRVGSESMKTREHVMEQIAIFVLASIFVIACVSEEAFGGRHHSCSYHVDPFDGIDFDIDDGSLLIEHDDFDDRVEITEDYELYINGRHIELDREQRQLVADYYETFTNIVDNAKEIGLKGAKIGVEGAKLGVKAIAKICKLALDGYNVEDLEREMEREAKKLEAKADKLEREAENLEDLAEDFENLHVNMRHAIPELDDLEWF
jgi:hypothetical protein